MISDMAKRPAWFYNEYQQIGTDFEDPAQVATYYRNQTSSTTESEQALVVQLNIRPGHTVIDFGCGAGTFAIQAALAGGRVEAVDISQTMLTNAQKQAKAAGVQTQIQFHHAGFLTYEHKADPVDVIVTKLALHHLPDFWKLAALLRMAAMLKQGGSLYLQDVIYSFNPVEYRPHIQAWIEQAVVTDDAGWARRDFETHVREEYSTFSWILEGMLQRAGFKIVEAEPVSSVWAVYLCQKV